MTGPTDVVIVTLPLLLLGWLAYDFAVLAYLGPRRGIPTITHRVVELSARYPVIPFLAGVVMGGLAVHFWFRP